jgi:hypothetical protein
MLAAYRHDKVPPESSNRPWKDTTLKSGQQSSVEMHSRQSATMFIASVGTIAFLVCLALIWFEVPVGGFLILSVGVLGTATGLSMLSGAVVPHSQRGSWRPPRGQRASIEIGRLFSLIAGICFTSGGVIFLRGGMLGGITLPAQAVWIFLATVAAGFAISLMGFEYDRRRAAGRATDEPHRRQNQNQAWFREKGSKFKSKSVGRSN